MKDNSIYLKHILDAISRIEEYTQGITFELPNVTTLGQR